EVKRRSADGSVGSPHARVGNCQASNKEQALVERLGLFLVGNLRNSSSREGPCLTTGAFLLPLKHQIRQDSAHKTAIHFNIESLTLATAPNILLN
ncbi:hypothetical protein LLQ46_00005, partial [Rouxiella badensis]|uniref:hypothetical protein n=1 Tax=Rouxiella badensis TaxID=1646377 RepID=UPI00197EE8BA